MTNLKILKTRINSIKSTRKITQAMKLVAASKLKKAREAIENNRPYTEEINNLATILLKQIPFKNNPILCGRDTSNRTCNHLILALGSDRGLCGSFNSNLAKQVLLSINNLKNKESTIKIGCIGTKIYSLLKWSTNYHVELIYPSASALAENAKTFALDLISKFDTENFDICTAHYNSFVTVLNRDILSKQILPICVPNSDEKQLFECEPKAQFIMQDLIKDLLIGNLISMSFETLASEHSARMTSMDNATRNAGEMIGKLITLYNRTRQAAVTTELIEIISGAESIKEGA